MENPIIFHLNATPLSEKIVQYFGSGHMQYRQFPDAESHLKLTTEITGRHVVIIESLTQPNTKILPLIFLARTVRDCGARSVGLVAPYLAYMRQDTCFNPGECESARYFADILSGHFDWLVTVDPHLHRINDLQQIFAIPTYIVSANKNIVNWIKQKTSSPLIIGPDSESKVWANPIAEELNAPVVIGNKLRKGDRKVAVSLPQLNDYQEYTPIVIDDIISTGQTVIQTIKQLYKYSLKTPICIATHGVFVRPAYQQLLKLKPQHVVTSNTITHQTNGIDLSHPLIDQIKTILGDNSHF